MIRVFIGYDQREAIAAQVLAYSINKRASEPVSITFLKSEQIHYYYRKRDEKQSTDFAYTRFLVPYMCNYDSGDSVFMDCDMLCLTDVADLIRSHNWADNEHGLRQPNDVSVVKHDYVPREKIKFLGQEQTVYPRKNWSSLMVFSNSFCRELDPKSVNHQTGMYLHQFKWAEHIGELSKDWNHLVGEYDPNPNAKIVHFTVGGPWFPEYENCEYADKWREEYEEMVNS